jgi:hypothetical protein
VLIEVIKRCFTLNPVPLVRSILSTSQTETTPLVPSTTRGNAYASNGIYCRNRDLGGQCCDRVRAHASLFPALAYPLHAQPHSAWCFLGVFRRGSCLITRNKRAANHPETRPILLFR